MAVNSAATMVGSRVEYWAATKAVKSVATMVGSRVEQ